MSNIASDKKAPSKLSMHSKDASPTHVGHLMEQSIDATPEENRGMIKSISGNISNIEELVNIIDARM